MFRLGTAELAAAGYLAVIVTTVAFVLWYSAVAGIGSGRAALLCGVAPVAAAVVGIATTGHVPTPPVWAGIAVVMAGLVVGLRTPAPSTDTPTTPTLGVDAHAAASLAAPRRAPA
ncbi:EamA family transporter [Nocardioides gansuensis]|uniref:EamA family transporter n=1 Tax=Nocardioides gansuensis TaxID=2138300 RepID=UPI001BAB9445|nr:EamA family transporter [Nocardioides gansuensis]